MFDSVSDENREVQMDDQWDVVLREFDQRVDAMFSSIAAAGSARVSLSRHGTHRPRDGGYVYCRYLVLLPANATAGEPAVFTIAICPPGTIAVPREPLNVRDIACSDIDVGEESVLFGPSETLPGRRGSREYVETLFRFLTHAERQFRDHIQEALDASMDYRPKE